MKRRLAARIILGLALTVSAIDLIALPCSASESRQPQVIHHQLSANVPLNSYVYDYLEKLDGIGYLQDMRTGAKPYTRMQVAKWVQQMTSAMSTRSNVPLYAQNMLSELQSAFSQELAVLQGSPHQKGVSLKEWTLGETYYKGNTLSQQKTASTYQPLNSNHNGYRYAPHANEVFTLRIEGNINNHLVVSATPRFSYDDTNKGSSSLESGYIKTNINNLEIQVGKDALWWGQGSRGSLLLTNNATSQTSIKLSNIDPIKPSGFFKFLGPSNTAFFYSILEDDRTDVKYPSLVGFRADFTPSSAFTFGAACTSIIGGQGHMLSGSDYWRFISGKNADTANSDEWDSIAGGDFRWRLSKWNGLQLYGELYGEDQAHACNYIPIPSEMAELAGVYIPRLSASGDWDAHLEWTHTRNTWYNHSLYKDGYTYKDNIMGDAIGNNAYRYYAKFTHFNSNGSQFALNLERVSQQFTSTSPQMIDSAWLSTRTKVAKDMFMDALFGIANIKNVGYTAGSKARNYIMGVSLTKQY